MEYTYSLSPVEFNEFIDALHTANDFTGIKSVAPLKTEFDPFKGIMVKPIIGSRLNGSKNAIGIQIVASDTKKLYITEIKGTNFYDPSDNECNNYVLNKESIRTLISSKPIFNTSKCSITWIQSDNQTVYSPIINKIKFNNNKGVEITLDYQNTPFFDYQRIKNMAFSGFTNYIKFNKSNLLKNITKYFKENNDKIIKNSSRKKLESIKCKMFIYKDSGISKLDIYNENNTLLSINFQIINMNVTENQEITFLLSNLVTVLKCYKHRELDMLFNPINTTAVQFNNDFERQQCFFNTFTE